MEKKGIIFAFVTALISGFSIFINAFGVKISNPFIFTGMKNILVAVFLLSFIVLAGNFRQLRQLKLREWKTLAIIGLVGGAIPFLLFFKGLKMAFSSAGGAFIHKTLFIWVLVLAVIFLKEKINWKIAIAAVLLFVGNLLLLKITKLSFGTGEVLILLATLFWAGETIISKKALAKMSSITVAFGRMFFGSIFIMIFLLSIRQLSIAFTLGTAQLGWILLTAVFLLGYVLSWYAALKHARATIATSILLIGSIVTTLLNLIFLDKLITIGQILGIVLLLAGVITFVGITDRILKTAYSFLFSIFKTH